MVEFKLRRHNRFVYTPHLQAEVQEACAAMPDE
jgi:hypothetical protein